MGWIAMGWTGRGKRSHPHPLHQPRQPAPDAVLPVVGLQPYSFLDKCLGAIAPGDARMLTPPLTSPFTLGWPVTGCPTLLPHSDDSLYPLEMARDGPPQPSYCLSPSIRTLPETTFFPDPFHFLVLLNASRVPHHQIMSPWFLILASVLGNST